MKARRVAVMGTLLMIAASCSTDDSDTEVTPLNPTTEPTAEQPDPAPTDEPTNVSTPTPAAVTRIHVEGHRGARGLKPENTLPAFETALDIGVTVLELDLHFTADDQVVVWHDDALTGDKCRLAAEAAAGQPDPADRNIAIRSLTVADLDSYQCDQNPEPARFLDQTNDATELAGADYRIVTLARLFDFVDTYMASPNKTDEQRANAEVVQFNIETKRDPGIPEGIGDGFDGTRPGPFELEVLAAVGAAGIGDRVVIQSFDHRSLWAIRSVDANIRLAALTAQNAPDLAEYATRGAQIWSPNFNLTTADLIAAAHAQGLLVIPWTVNSVDDMTRMLDMGVDGLITDRPDLAVTLDR